MCEEAYGNHNVSKQYRGEEKGKKNPIYVTGIFVCGVSKAFTRSKKSSY